MCFSHLYMCVGLLSQQFSLSSNATSAATRLRTPNLLQLREFLMPIFAPLSPIILFVQSMCNSCNLLLSAHNSRGQCGTKDTKNTWHVLWIVDFSLKKQSWRFVHACAALACEAVHLFFSCKSGQNRLSKNGHASRGPYQCTFFGHFHSSVKIAVQLAVAIILPTHRP